jgi:hypothetical protein
MSHYAKVLNGKVIQVIIAEPEFFNTFTDTSPGQWIQTSYNTRGGIHYGQDGNPDGGTALRGNYASIDYIYDLTHDVFYAPKPYPSWALNQSTWLWESPIPYPNDGKSYKWDEGTISWIENNGI